MNRSRFWRWISKSNGQESGKIISKERIDTKRCTDRSPCPSSAPIKWEVLPFVHRPPLTHHWSVAQHVAQGHVCESQVTHSGVPDVLGDNGPQFLNDAFCNWVYHLKPTTSIPYHMQPYCSAEKSVEECLVRLLGNKELDWGGKKTLKLETCLLGGLPLLSLPNSSLINGGFMLEPHWCKTEEAA